MVKKFQLTGAITWLLIFSQCASAQHRSTSVTEVGKGWARNSVNTTIFRKNSIVSHDSTQYIAFYNQEQQVVLGKRNLTSDRWSLKTTFFTGNATDAHNSISIMVDGKGYLHMAWDHHNNELRYARSKEPWSLSLSKADMVGKNETSVSYPEFYKLPGGDLLYFYRDGASGNGNLVINRYNNEQKKWSRVQDNLIDGEGERNAYWQATIDKQGTIHLSWVWRETWDVATNHDMCYARSKDGGKTWQTSSGKRYDLPITQKTAEIVAPIAQNSELINQTSITTTPNNQPVIATYFKDKTTNKTQYHLIYLSEDKWHVTAISSRKSDFSLSGGGTKKIPISRPQVLMGQNENSFYSIVIFRDEERENRPSIFLNTNFPHGQWQTIDLSAQDLGQWEPSYDTELWKDRQMLSLFVQPVKQQDAEGVTDIGATLVKVLNWTFTDTTK